MVDLPFDYWRPVPLMSGGLNTQQARAYSHENIRTFVLTEYSRNKTGYGTFRESGSP